MYILIILTSHFRSNVAMLVNALLSRRIVTSFLAASRIGSDVSTDVLVLRQRQDSILVLNAHDRENALMPFVRGILHRSQSGGIVMDTRIHKDASSKCHQYNITRPRSGQPVASTPSRRRELVDASSLDVYRGNLCVKVLGKYAEFDGASPCRRFQNGRDILVAWSPVSPSTYIPPLKKIGRALESLHCRSPCLAGCHRPRLAARRQSQRAASADHSLCRIFGAFAMSCSNMSAIDEKRQELSSGTTCRGRQWLHARERSDGPCARARPSSSVRWPGQFSVAAQAPVDEMRGLGRARWSWRWALFGSR